MRVAQGLDWNNFFKIQNEEKNINTFVTDKNHLNEEITPLLATGIGERLSQTISNLGHAALLRRCELPL